MISTNGYPGPLVSPVSRALRPRPESTSGPATAPVRRKPQQDNEPAAPDEAQDGEAHDDETQDDELHQPHQPVDGPLGQHLSRLV